MTLEVGIGIIVCLVVIWAIFHLTARKSKSRQMELYSLQIEVSKKSGHTYHEMISDCRSLAYTIKASVFCKCSDTEHYWFSPDGSYTHRLGKTWTRWNSEDQIISKESDF